jgi:SAM-dependent methyltransferase
MLTARSFVEVDALANVVTFDTLADESQDFAIIHDVIEHLDNPLLALKNWLRVLKPEGILLISAPDKRFTFDYQREITPFAHLERDFMEGPEWSRLDAYREWYRFVDEAPDVEKAAVEGSEKNDDIHFHSWTHCEIMEMLIESKRRLGLQFEFKLILENEGELLIAMKKTQVQVYDRAAGATTAAP